MPKLRKSASVVNKLLTSKIIVTLKNLYSDFLIWLGLGVIVFFIFAQGKSAFAAPGKMQSEDIRILIEQARNAWIAGDSEAIAQMFTIDGELIVPGKRWQGQAKIRSGVTRFAQQYSDVKINIHRLLITGNHVTVEWHYEDTDNLTRVRHQVDDAIVIDFRDGKISRWREYFDDKTPKLKSSYS